MSVTGRLAYKTELEWKRKLENHWNVDVILSHRTEALGDRADRGEEA